MKIDFEKMDGLVPVIIQHYKTLQVLMLGYMNEEAYRKTRQENKVTFYSRSKKRLWTKGETSGHYLMVKNIQVDCDVDTILIMADPAGPTCHTGDVSCFGATGASHFFSQLETIIDQRRVTEDENSYTSRLLQKGTAIIAQKVGEEAVEVVIEALQKNNDKLVEESADLIYHWLVLLADRGIKLGAVEQCLFERHHK
jgi:phosphoribosyl-ATP pyrophosphohydrolase/phosphoribosyl-AMP cyclohydrolase